MNTPYVFRTVLMNTIFYSLAGRAPKRVIMTAEHAAEGLTLTNGTTNEQYTGGEPCKFVDSPGRFLNLYKRLYGPYNLPYKLKNRPGESTNLQVSPPL